MSLQKGLPSGAANSCAKLPTLSVFGKRGDRGRTLREGSLDDPLQSEEKPEQPQIFLQPKWIFFSRYNFLLLFLVKTNEVFSMH